jgi:predicted AAA+ superfamily ATPase
LDELHRIREIQIAQTRALAEGDIEELERLGRLRRKANDDLLALGERGMAASSEARALAEELLAADRELLEAAEARREEVGLQIGELARGRGALGGYRPGRASSRLLDKAG